MCGKDGNLLDWYVSKVSLKRVCWIDLSYKHDPKTVERYFETLRYRKEKQKTSLWFVLCGTHCDRANFSLVCIFLASTKHHVMEAHFSKTYIFFFLFAHLSRPWSIGWVALSFLVRLFVVPPAIRPNLHFFSIYRGIKALYQPGFI